MNTSPAPTNGRSRGRRALRRAHRWGGLTLVVFVVLLSATGIALNHTDDLNLDSRYIAWPWLLDAYGLEVPDPSASFAAGGHRATLLGERLFLDGRDTGHRDTTLAGLVASDNWVAAGGQYSVYLFTPAGEFVEAIDLGPMLESPIDAMGHVEDRVVIRSADVMLQSDVDIASFADWENPGFDAWSVASLPAEQEMVLLEKAWRGQGVSVERFLLDLHSGRVLGWAGRLLLDVVAVFLILLSITGVVMSSVRNRRR